MKYKIEIWQFHSLVETFESDNVNKVLEWYRAEWKMAYDYGQCTFYLYENGKMLDFDTKYDLGFFKDEDDTYDYE